jgi:hypothetical protein
MIRNEIDDQLYCEAEIENIERDAVGNQPGWKARLDRPPGPDREKAFETLLHPSAYERRRILKEMLSQT